MYEGKKESGMMKNKKPETLVAKGLQASLSDDPDWVRTSDPHPVKVVLSQLSYGIIIFLSITFNNIME